MKIEGIRQRPYLAGLLLGLSIWVLGNILRAEGVVWMAALTFIGAGVVLAVYGNGWYKSAGKTLAATGVAMLLTPVVIGFTGTQAALGL